MTTFLHTADWHLGSPQHPKIYKDNVLPAFSKLLTQNYIQSVLCVGDVFDVHNPDQKTKDALLKFLLETPNCSFYFVAGNHDYSDKTRTYHSLEYLKILADKLNNVVVIDKTGVDEIFFGNCRLKMLSFVTDSWEEVEAFECAEDVDILAWHGTVPGISFEKGVEYKKDARIDNLINKYSAKYFALGDIHKHLQLNKRCWYPGALVQKTYGCESGVVKVELDTKITTASLRLDLPLKHNLNVTFEVGKDSEKSIVAFVKNNIAPKSLIRLIFNLPLAVWGGLDKEYIKQELVDFEEVKLDNIPVVDVVKRNNFENIKKCQTAEEELKMVIDQEPLDINKRELLEVCKEYV